MPSQEPNENMDELLKAYAKKRREQAEPALEMHPATRKLLQDEVERTLGATPAATPTPTPAPWYPSWFSALWPFGALGSTLAVVCLMFALFHTPARNPLPGTVKAEGGRKKEENFDLLTRNPSLATAPAGRGLSEAKAVPNAAAPLADKDSSPALVAAPATTAAVAGSGVPAQVDAPPAVTSLAAQTAAATPPGIAADTTPAPVLPQASSVAQYVAQEGRIGGASLEHASAVGSTAPGSVPAAAEDASGVVAGAFVQVYDRARSSRAESPPSNVLSAFQLLHAGQNVRVVDADGSIYDGQVLAGISNGGPTEGLAQRRIGANQEANYAFKVAGTNHTLQQNIIFTGNVLDMPVAAPAGQFAAQNRNASQVQNAASNGLAQSAQNSRITGQVQVGGGKEFKIEAKPPSP
jgi:hypothetical protein